MKLGNIKARHKVINKIQKVQVPKVYYNPLKYPHNSFV